MLIKFFTLVNGLFGYDTCQHCGAVQTGIHCSDAACHNKNSAHAVIRLREPLDGDAADAAVRGLRRHYVKQAAFARRMALRGY